MQKNAVKKKMKQSTKVWLLLACGCLVLGLSFMVFSIFQGPSYWFAWDGHQLVSSNAAGTYKENKELEPFSSIVIDVPAQSYTIRAGDRFSIDYKSNYPGIQPELKLEDGVLSYVAGSVERMEVMDMGIQNVYSGMRENNYVEITVPTGTKLDSITLSKAEGSYRNYGSVSYLNLINLQVGTLDCNVGDPSINVGMDNVQADRIELTDFTSGVCEHVTADTIALHYTSRAYGFFDANKLQFISTTANRLTADNERTGRDALLEVERINDFENIYPCVILSIEASQIKEMDLLADAIILDDVTSEQVTALSTGNLTVEYCNFTGTTVLRAAGDITMNTRESAEEWSGSLCSGYGYKADLVTEYADFGTEAYDYGYVTSACKDYGVQKIAVTQDEYDEIQNNWSDYRHNQDEDDFYETTMSVFDGQLAENDNRKYRDYVDMDYEYDEDGNFMGYITVYNRKQVTYYTNSEGMRVYVNNPNADDTALTINSSCQQGQRYVLPGTGSKILDSYSYGRGKYQFGLS